MDLDLLDDLCTRADLIAWAEGPHNCHECLTVRTDVLTRLVHAGRVATVAAETGFSEALLTNDYVTGGDGSVESAAHGVWSWNPAPLAENVRFVDRLREHNANDAAPTVQFRGIDLCGGRRGKFVDARICLDQALATANSAALSARLDPLLPFFSSSRYRDLDNSRRDALTDAIGDLADALAVMTDAPAVDRARRQCVIASLHDLNFRTDPSTWTWEIRDRAQISTLAWAIDRSPPGTATFLYDQVSHLDPLTDGSTGSWVRGTFGDRCVMIAAAWGDGTDTRARPPIRQLGAALHASTAADAALIDLRPGTPLHHLSAGFDAVYWTRNPSPATEIRR